MKFYSSIKKKLAKKKLREEAGRLHFQLLKLERGDRAQISNRASNGLGRFHIFPVSRFPRLEFCDWNVLLENWLPLHYGWHHFGPKDRSNEETVRRIELLTGKTWRELEEYARIQKKILPKHDELYLRALIEYYKQKVNSIERTGRV